MITPFQIYLISIADDISVFLTTIFVLLIIATIVCGIALIINTIEDNEDLCCKFKYAAKIFTIITFISGILCSLSPSTKTFIAMYTIPTIVNNKEVQKLPENLVKFANGYLDKLNKKEDNK